MKMVNLSNYIIKIFKRKYISTIINTYSSGIISMPFINITVALVTAFFSPLAVLMSLFLFLFLPLLLPLSLLLTENVFAHLHKDTFFKCNSAIPAINNEFKILLIIKYFII